MSAISRNHRRHRDRVEEKDDISLRDSTRSGFPAEFPAEFPADFQGSAHILARLRSRTHVLPRWLHRVAGRAIRLWLRLDVSGAHHIPRTGGFILAANHTSHADIVALGAASPRELMYLGSSHLTRVPLVGWLFPRIGMLPVDRGAADGEVLDLLIAHLRNGGGVVVFPEGGRSRDGRVWRPRSGVARIAGAACVPVVPVGISGAVGAWPVGVAPRWRRHTVRVRFGSARGVTSERRDRRAFLDALHGDLVRLSGARAATGLLAVGIDAQDRPTDQPDEPDRAA